MPLTTYAANKLLDHINGKTSYTMPTTYLALFTAQPTLAGGGTEVAGGSYARIALSMGAASSGQATSNAAHTFTCPACTITGWGIYDASTAGNLLFFDVIEQTATNEAVTLVSGLVSLANANVSTVIVKNSAETTTYVEGTDYYVEYDQGIIVRIPSGAITSSQVLHVTYNYPQTRTLLSGDQYNFPSGNLSDTFKGWL